MRVVVFAFCLALTPLQLCASEENGSPEVQPVVQEKSGVDSQRREEYQTQNTDEEHLIRFPVRTFERLVEAIEGKKEEPKKKNPMLI